MQAFVLHVDAHLEHFGQSGELIILGDSPGKGMAYALALL